jgi:hypothetical protein
MVGQGLNPLPMGNYTLPNPEMCMNEQCAPYYTGSASGTQLKYSFYEAVKALENPQAIFELGPPPGYPKNPTYVSIWATVANQPTLGKKEKRINAVKAKHVVVAHW